MVGTKGAGHHTGSEWNGSGQRGGLRGGQRGGGPRGEELCELFERSWSKGKRSRTEIGKEVRVEGAPIVYYIGLI